VLSAFVGKSKIAAGRSRARAGAAAPLGRGKLRWGTISAGCRPFQGQTQRLPAGFRQQDLETGPPQMVLHQLEDALLVVDHQHAATASVVPCLVAHTRPSPSLLPALPV